MTNENKNVNNLPYAQWLEHTIKDLIDLPVKGLCLNAVLEDGSVYTAYHKISMQNKITIAGVIQQDATIETLTANGFIEIVEEDEEDSAYGKEED
jgi:hypothetical protein